MYLRFDFRGPNCEQARTRAITIIAAANNSEDPVAKRDARRTAIKVRELSKRFNMEHISLQKKPIIAK